MKLTDITNLPATLKVKSSSSKNENGSLVVLTKNGHEFNGSIFSTHITLNKVC